jgi:ABC-2 type transport system permease protein
VKRALRAEWRKARTVRAFGLLLGGALLVELAFKGMFAALQAVESLDRAGQYRLFGPTLFLTTAAALLGVLIAGQEWRYRLAVPTYLAFPGRRRVLAAKAVVAGTLASVTGLVATGLADILCAALLRPRLDTLVSLADGGSMVAGTALACGLLAVGGVALGTLVRSQVTAVGIAVTVLLVLAPLTQLLVPEVAAGLPGGAAQALALQANVVPAFLAPVTGGLVLAAEVALITAVAAWQLRRADVI